MPRLYQVTVPGLVVKADLAVARTRLLGEFPEVQDVLATLTPATLLVVYHGRDRIEAWLDTLSDSVIARRGAAGRPSFVRPGAQTKRPRRWTGGIGDARELGPAGA